MNLEPEMKTHGCTFNKNAFRVFNDPKAHDQNARMPVAWQRQPSWPARVQHKIADSDRVEKALYLLLNEHYDFGEIASELGYNSVAQFDRAFASIMGELPHAYRARI